MHLAVATVAAFLTGVLANDVYSVFVSADFKQIGGTQYDVSNTECFQNAGATQLEFQQASQNKLAAGPYCLYAYSDSNCATQVAHQEFSSVHLDGTDYPLQAVAGQQYWTWDPNGCPPN